MPEDAEENSAAVELAGKDLFNFAIDREDIKSLTALLPEESACKPEALEYELQILKIISTGWSISFFLKDRKHRDELAEIFWQQVHEFSRTLSETTQLMTGRDINYFQILNDRLDMYVEALNKNPGAKEPAAVIGPEFAGFCGSTDDIFAVMTGSRLFILTVARVKDFLEKTDLQ